MSAAGILLYLALLAGACAASWKLALYWNLRTRAPREEDPRDQEIRELNAALSIARRQLAAADQEGQSNSSTSDELAHKLERLSSTLSDTKQKYIATKEHLNRLTVQNRKLNEENRVLRAELASADTTPAE